MSAVAAQPESVENLGSNAATQENSYSEHPFLQVTELPGSTSGRKRKIGIVLYFLCFLLAIAGVFMMLSESNQYYTKDYESKAGDFSASLEHRLPDLVLCPSRARNPKQDYAVFYEWRVIKEIGMNMEKVSKLTKLQYQSCSAEGACREVETHCRLTEFENECKKAGNLIESYRKRNFSRLDWKMRDPINPISKEKMMPGHAYIINNELELNNYTWTLGILWMTIIEAGHTQLRESLNNGMKSLKKLGEVKSTIDCFLYDQGTDDLQSQKRCRSTLVQSDFWLGKSLCTWIDGSKMPATRTPYIGVRKTTVGNYFTRHNTREPIRYWIGNLRTMELSENALASIHNFRPRFKKKQRFQIMRKIAGVAHYTSIMLEKNEKDNKNCIKQMAILGLTVNCQAMDSSHGLNLTSTLFFKNSEDEVLKPSNRRWFYDVSLDGQRRLTTLWIYPGTREIIVQARTYTAYTLYQIAAGVFGSCLGVSLVQLLEAGIALFKDFHKVTNWKLHLFRGIAYIFLIIITAAFTIWDTAKYVDARIGKQLERRKLEHLPVPVIQLCNGGGDFAFWNVTRLYELNVSAELYSYMRLAVMNQRSPLLDVTYQQVKEDGISKILANDWIGIDSPFQVNRSICDKPDCRLEALRIANPNRFLFWTERLRIAKFAYLSKEFNRTEYFTVVRSIMDELEDLRIRLQLPPNFALRDLIQPLSLSLRQHHFLNCKIGSTFIEDCGRYAHYFKEGRTKPEHCLQVSLPSDKYSLSMGYREGLSIQIDGTAFQEHSDINAYYGSEVPRNLVLENSAHTKCYEEKELEFEKVGCIPPDSFELKILHPDGDNKPTLIVYPSTGPNGWNGFSINIRNTLKSLIPRENNCMKEADRVCRFGKDEIGALLRAVQSQILCQCLNCFDLKPSQHIFLENLLSENLHCCTPREDIECNAYLFGSLELKPHKGDYNYNIASGRAMRAFRNLFSFRNNLLHESRIITTQLIKDMLGIVNPNTNLTFIEKLKSFIETCKKQRCYEKRFKLVSVTESATDGRYDKIHIFFDSEYEEGTTQVDRLDLAQFVGIMFCTYGTTIGISLIALFELCQLSTFRRCSAKSITEDMESRVFLGQMFRGISVLMEILNVVFEKSVSTEEDCVSVAKSSAIFDPVNVSNAGDPPNGVETDYHSIEKTSQTSSRAPSLASLTKNSSRISTASNHSGYEQQLPFDQNTIAALHNEEIASENSSAILSARSTEKLPPISDATSDHSKTLEIKEEAKLKADIPMASYKHDLNEKKKGRRLTFVRAVTTSLSMFLMTVLVIYFVVSSKTTDISMEVLQSPIINLPSFGVCLSSNGIDLVRITELLNVSRCRILNSKITEPCSSTFSMIVQSKSHVCAVLDNSRRTNRLTLNSQDIEILIPRNSTNETVSIWVDGLNETMVEDQGPSIEWRPEKDMILSYAVSLFQDTSISCATAKIGSCPVCRMKKKIKETGVCCLKSEQTLPVQLRQKNRICYHYIYSTVVSLSKTPKYVRNRKLTLVPKSQFVIVSTVKDKYDWISLMSILGGFIDFFTGLTVLNMTCAIIFCTLSLITSVVSLSERQVR